jgi:hypothetical protein
MKRITLCGSTKFKAEFEAINRQLSLEGNVVYSVAFFGHADNVPLTPEQKATLDEVHKRKIDNSDIIFVVDVDGYIGESTRSEIEYAESTGKRVTYLSSYPDLKWITDSAMEEYASTLNRELKEEVEFQTEILSEVISQLDKLMSAARSIKDPELVAHAVGVELPYKIANLKEIKAKLTALSESYKEDKPLE